MLGTVYSELGGINRSPEKSWSHDQDKRWPRWYVKGSNATLRVRVVSAETRRDTRRKWHLRAGMSWETGWASSQKKQGTQKEKVLRFQWSHDEVLGVNFACINTFYLYKYPRLHLEVYRKVSRNLVSGATRLGPLATYGAHANLRVSICVLGIMIEPFS